MANLGGIARQLKGFGGAVTRSPLDVLTDILRGPSLPGEAYRALTRGRGGWTGLRNVIAEMGRLGYLTPEQVKILEQAALQQEQAGGGVSAIRRQLETARRSGWYTRAGAAAGIGGLGLLTAYLLLRKSKKKEGKR